MSEHSGKKFKRPHTIAEFQAMQDQVGRLEEKLRNIRLNMEKEQFESIEIMSGTFATFTERLHTVVADWENALQKAIIRKSARATIVKMKSKDKFDQ